MTRAACESYVNRAGLLLLTRPARVGRAVAKGSPRSGEWSCERGQRRCLAGRTQEQTLQHGGNSGGLWPRVEKHPSPRAGSHARPRNTGPGMQGRAMPGRSKRGRLASWPNRCREGPMRGCPLPPSRPSQRGARGPLPGLPQPRAPRLLCPRAALHRPAALRRERGPVRRGGDRQRARLRPGGEAEEPQLPRGLRAAHGRPR